MTNRRIAAALIALLAAIVVPGVGLSAAPAGAAISAFEMEMTEGTLTLDDAEPTALEDPTTLSGIVDDATGAITQGALATPTIRTQRQITSPITADVFIDVDLVPVPGTAVAGSITSEGVLSLQAQVEARLHIEVGQDPVFIEADCRATPISIGLTSTAPYDEDADAVTVSDADFTIPPVVDEPACADLVQGPINEELAGAGNALTLALTGVLPLPAAPRAATATALAVDPAGSSPMGTAVSLTATVAEVEGSDGAPTGEVEFLDGSRVVATGVLASGTASADVTGLTAGAHQLRARYVGDGAFAPSTSSPTAHTVTRLPSIGGTAPPTVTVGGEPAVIDVIATNPLGGVAIPDARMDISFRLVGSGAGLTADNTTAEVEGPPGTWTPLALTASGTTLVGNIDPAAGSPLPPGTTRSARVRVAVSAAVSPGTMRVTTTLVDAAPDPDATVATSSKDVLMVPETRRPTTLGFSLFSLDPSDTRNRPGYFLQLSPFLDGAVNPSPDAYYEAFVDGRRIAVYAAYSTEPPVERYPVDAPEMVVPLPRDLASGAHTLTLRFSGDSINAPDTSDPLVLDIKPALGPLYDCDVNGYPFAAYVEARADVPSSALPGEPFSLDRAELKVSFAGGHTIDTFAFTLPSFDTAEADVPGGTLTGESVAYSYDPTAEIQEQTVTFTGSTGSAAVDGDPGDTVPLDVSEVRFGGVDPTFDLRYTATCRPADAAVSLAEVTVAGTTLAVEAPTPTRAGDLVRLEATVAPADASGVVSFHDGDTEIGAAFVVDGMAQMWTDELAVGAHSLTATFEPGLGTPSSSSAATALTVLPTYECAAFVGSDPDGAVVRLTYLELLRRCPDTAGFAYWKGRLDGGVSATTFARSIAYTNEALDQVVIDAYRTVLERDPSPTDRTFWRNRLKANGRYQQLLADLSASPEFFALGGSTREGLVTRVYQQLLGREPLASDLDYWTGELLKGRPRGTVMRVLSGLAEPVGVIVDRSFDEILSQEPGSAERADEVRLLQRTGDRSGLYSRLIGDARFRARATENPNPED